VREYGWIGKISDTINTRKQILNWGHLQISIPPQINETNVVISNGAHPPDNSYTDCSTFGCTGQRNNTYINLLDYGARWYSSSLGRFTQPDTIVPDLTNTQAWNRFSYTYNNPINYTDPSGHIPEGACGYGNWDCKTDSGNSSPTGDNGNSGGGDQPGNIDEDTGSGYPAFDPTPAPDWMPDFMAQDYRYAQNAMWVLSHPNATAHHQEFAALVLSGYITGYGGLLAGLSMLGYAGAQAIFNTVGLACVSNPVCATATGLGGVGAEAVCADGDCTNEVSSAAKAVCSDGDCSNEVDFVVSENGNVYPLPSGATGPSPTINGQGVRWESGGFGFRVMNPSPSVPYPYANYYKILPGGSYQTLNPLTGQSIPPSDIMWHIPLDGTWVP
jgi:RHS repeat-associated protein